MNTTRIGKDKTRIAITLHDDSLVLMDKVVAAAGVTRSALLEGCFEAGLQNLCFLDFMGLSLRRLNIFRKKLELLKK